MLDELLSLGTSAVSDALDSMKTSGGIMGPIPRTALKCFAGPAFTVVYEPLKEVSGFMPAGDYIDDVKSGDVIVVDNGGRNDCTTWGEILTIFAKKRRVAGTIVSGAIRDLPQICDLNYPILSTHVFMQSGKNRVRKVAQNVPVKIGNIIVNPGDIILADGNGCISIPREKLDVILSRARAIAKTEDEIINAIKNDMSLKEARAKFKYTQPWAAKC